MMFHPIISSIQKVALYETKTVSVFDYFCGFKLISHTRQVTNDSNDGQNFMLILDTLLGLGCSI